MDDVSNELIADGVVDWPPLLLAAEKGDVAGLRAALASGADVKVSDQNGWTALHLASLNGRAAVVDVLVEHPDVDVNAKNRWSSTPLMLAASRGYAECVRALMRHPDTDIDARAEYYGRTALIEAAKNGFSDIVKMLLDRGADVNVTDKTGRNNALIEAIKGRHYAVSELIMNSGRMNFLKKDMRLNALIWAGATGNRELRENLDFAIARFFEGA